MPGVSGLARVLERSKRRMSCRVHAEGRQHNGIVLDLSGSGLFIQTGARLSPGARVDLDLSLPDEVARMQVDVVRRKQVPAQLLTVAQGGIGVRIVSAPESYYRFLQHLQQAEQAAGAGPPPAAAAPVREATPPRVAPTLAAPGASRPATPAAPAPPAPPRPAPAAPKVAEPPKPRFRVRVCQTQGARSRVIDVAAHDAEEAGRQVLRELGEEWKLLKVEAL